MGIQDLKKIDENLERLLVSLRQEMETIDCAYILHGARNWQKAVEKCLPTGTNILFYHPKLKILKSGEINPAHLLLIVDDSFYSGRTFRSTVGFFIGQGYSLDSIFGLHVLGEGLQGGGEKYGIPMLASAKEYLDKILPQLESNIRVPMEQLPFFCPKIENGDK